MLWKQFFLPASLDEALKLKAELGASARFIAGGTDLVIDLDRGRIPPCALIDISRLTELQFIQVEERGLRLGGGLTHARLLQSREVREQANLLAQAAVEVGAPQIRNRSTLSGNLVTASPAADTVPPLVALDAVIELESVRGRREIPITQFLTGFRQVDLAEDEVVRSILIPRAQGQRRGAFLKLGLRNAQAISVVCLAASLEFDEVGRVLKAGIALGSVAPVTIRVPKAEELLVGQPLSDALIKEATIAAHETATPISDVRGSAAYRKQMVKVYTARALRYIQQAQTPPPSADPDIFLQVSSPESRVQSSNSPTPNPQPPTSDVVEFTVNGHPVSVEGAGDKVLLYALRQAGLTGTKEGCLEGECGACTVLLDGSAVDSCLVPAPRAQGCEITTVEGLAHNGQLHPLQASFIEQGGVQCGFCTPGLIMSGSTLLAERPEGVDEWQCRSALVGNLCRCTGYNKVLAAMAEAQRQMVQEEAQV